jgi:hypothetical protein
MNYASHLYLCPLKATYYSSINHIIHCIYRIFLGSLQFCDVPCSQRWPTSHAHCDHPSSLMPSFHLFFFFSVFWGVCQRCRIFWLYVSSSAFFWIWSVVCIGAWIISSRDSLSLPHVSYIPQHEINPTWGLSILRKYFILRSLFSCESVVF